MVIVGVSVAVDVIVKVAVGGTFVGVKVAVVVGVADAKRLNVGFSGPTNHTITKTIPTITRINANPQMINGSICCFLLYEAINFLGSSLFIFCS